MKALINELKYEYGPFSQVLHLNLFSRAMLDGRLRAGLEVLQPAEEDHDP